MPLIDLEEAQKRLELQRQLAPNTGPEPEAPGFTDVFKASVAENNTAVNAIRLADEALIDDTNDETFSLGKELDLEDNLDLRPYAEAFVKANNKGQFDYIANNIRQRNERIKTFEESSGVDYIAGMLAAELVDPVNWPSFGIGSMAKVGKRLHVAKKAAIGAGAFGAAGTVQEGLSVAALPSKPVSEGVINVLAQTAVGGLLGAGIGIVTRPGRKLAQEEVKAAMTGSAKPRYRVKQDAEGNVEVTPLEARSAGAAEVEATDLSGEALSGRVAEQVLRFGSLGTNALRTLPMRGLLSVSDKMHELTNKLMEHNLFINKELEGISRGNVTQKLMLQDEFVNSSITSQYNKLYLDYTGVGRFRSSIESLRPEGKITEREFSARVHRALSEDGYVDKIDQVNKAANILKKRLDEVTEQLQSVGKLAEDVDKVALRKALTRSFNKSALLDPALKAKVRGKMVRHFQKFDTLGNKRAADLAEDDALKIADDALDNIERNGSNLVKIADEMVRNRRVFNQSDLLFVPDEVVDDIVDKDAIKVFNGIADRASRIVRTNQGLNELGYSSLKDIHEALNKEAADKLKLLDPNSKEAIKIKENLAEDLELADGMYKALMGQIRKPSKIDPYINTLKNYQYVRLLGGVTLTSLGEPFMAVFRAGFVDTFKHAWLPYFKNIKTATLARDQLNDLTGAMEFESNAILKHMGEDLPYDQARPHTWWESLSANMSTAHSSLSGINWFTGSGRRIAGQVGTANIIRMLRKVEKTDLEVAKLANLGIGKADYEKVLKEINSKVEEYDGSFILNPGKWEDTDALNIMKQAIQSHIESMVLRPNISSKPLWTQETAVGSLLWQFKSFMTKVTGSLTANAAQRMSMGDLTAYTGLMTLLAAGTAIYALKEKIKGREVEDINDLILGGLIHSGVLGLAATSVLELHRGLNSYGGRFADDQIRGLLLGPAVGTIKDVTKFATGLGDGVDEKDADNFIKLLPFQNLWYIQDLIKKATGNQKKKGK